MACRIIFACGAIHQPLNRLPAVSCDIGLIETTGPSGGTQKRECWDGPTNHRAAACRHHLATSLSMADGRNQRRYALRSLLSHLPPPLSLFFTKAPLPPPRHFPPAVRRRWFLPAPTASSAPIRLFRCTTATPAAATTPVSRCISGPPARRGRARS